MECIVGKCDEKLNDMNGTSKVTGGYQSVRMQFWTHCAGLGLYGPGTQPNRVFGTGGETFDRGGESEPYCVLCCRSTECLSIIQ